MINNNRFLLTGALMMLISYCPAQLLEPASWDYTLSNKDAKKTQQVDLIFRVKIEKDWYLYATDFDDNLGPMVTTFDFQPDPSYELVGNIQSIKPQNKYSDVWKGTYTYFVDTAQFRQTIRVLGDFVKVKGKVAYQVCTDVDGQCIPFDEDFSFPPITVRQIPDESNANKTSTIDRLDTSPPQIEEEEWTDIPITGTPAEESQMNAKLDEVPLTVSENGSTSLLSFMLLAFLAGMAALITPCVFPMIPMTVSFFTSSSKSRKQAIFKALLFGFAIILIYTLIGTIVSRINGPAFANWLSTHWLPNVLFFIIFILFGLSFLGMFEIVLPSSIVNKMDKEADKGGYYGILFMSFTIVLVSFSCTGPIVGSILVESAGGAILKPIAGMFSFAMAFAIPFTLFAIFPHWMKNLPKSGSWLNSVKVVLGFLELALAFKFLSTADQVYHWKLLDREIFLALWIAIFLGLALYLMGKIKLPHDAELKTVTVPRLVLSLLTLTFVIYLVPGLFGAPLKALAGFLPPMNTQDFNLSVSMNTEKADTDNNLLCEVPHNPAGLSFPHGIQGYFDMEQALACAREQKKPIFIDFTGHGCVNCRKMEERVWAEPEVLKRLKNEFVMLALYVDEKTELPKSQWYTSAYDGKIKKTIGSQSVDLQIVRFQNNAQPYYILLNPNTEKVLIQPVAYETDVQKFIDFLDAGIAAFKNQPLVKNGATAPDQINQLSIKTPKK